MRRRDIRPGKVYTDHYHLGRRIVTRKTRDTVFYICLVTREGHGRFAAQLGGGHCSIHRFVSWASKEL